jgi:hypothetical protein
MKPFLLALLLIGAPAVKAADVAPITFYIQLIRGSDQDTPPLPDAHLIGDKLNRRLHDIFKWKNYWEVKREAVTLKQGMGVRKKMSPERDVEITWTGDKNMVVSIYTNGKVTRKRQQSTENTFYIAGGDNDATESWFIIVRRDNPEANRNRDANPKPAETP